MMFVRCSKCGQLSIDNEWSGAMKMIVCGRTFHLCESCGSEVLNYILEGTELTTEKEDDEDV